MAASLFLVRSPILRAQSSQTLKTIFFTQPLRSQSTSTTTPSHHNDHKVNHEYTPPSEFINTWKTPKTPKEAEAKLLALRREYAKKVKEVRREYTIEMELQRQEKIRKAEAKSEAQRIANEERRAAKAVQKKAKAELREVTRREFRETLLKERTEKLEYWRAREKLMQEKRMEKRELLRRQSSMWIDEPELEKKILEAVLDVTQL
ncbi:stress response protein NST1 [Cornus florida]|uniref:stress response protein NST1 n=1 Tax=Cornus florida TaxID=4283 RepID=UPI00289E836C|nr:stress response protein NST1 [Cornus florida]